MIRFRKSSKTVFAFAMAVVLGVSLALSHLPNVMAENISQEWKQVNGEWIEENGTLSPATENAVMQYATKLSGDFKISFDLKLSAVYDTMTGFQMALFANEGDADMAYAYAVNINTVDNSVSVLNNTEYTATVISTIATEKTLRDDTARNVTIISYQDKLYVSYDGQKVVTGKAMTVTEGYLNLSASSIYDAISNFTYANSYVPTEEEMVNDQLLDVHKNAEDKNAEDKNVENKNDEDEQEEAGKEILGDNIVSWGDATEGIVNDNKEDNSSSENVVIDKDTTDKDTTDKDTTDRDTADKEDIDAETSDKDTTDDDPAGNISVKEYTITYNVNNENATIDTTTQTVTYGEEFVLAIPKVVSGDDYQFVKWVITGTSTEFKSGKYNLHSDVSLTAVWEDNYSKNY